MRHVPQHWKGVSNDMFLNIGRVIVSNETCSSTLEGLLFQMRHVPQHWKGLFQMRHVPQHWKGYCFK